MLQLFIHSGKNTFCLVCLALAIKNGPKTTQDLNLASCSLVKWALSKIWCQLQLVEGRRKVCIYQEPESFGHARDVSSEAYNFFNVKKLSLSSKGLNIRENDQNWQLCATAKGPGKAAAGSSWWRDLEVQAREGNLSGGWGSVKAFLHKFRNVTSGKVNTTIYFLFNCSFVLPWSVLERIKVQTKASLTQRSNRLITFTSWSEMRKGKWPGFYVLCVINKGDPSKELVCLKDCWK